MIYAAHGSIDGEITDRELVSLTEEALRGIGRAKRVVAVPPDITRLHSRAGSIVDIVAGIIGDRLSAVLPALGTHVPMTAREISMMYPGTPSGLFRVHDWRRDPIELGRIPASFVREASEGVVDYDYPVQVNRMLTDGSVDAILSVGQVVPHEITGMSNHAKNLFVGTGGKEAIDKSHFLGAVYGMERITGRIDTPVRRIFEEALKIALPKMPPVIWILTVIGRNSAGELSVKGFFAGDDSECFVKASSLSRLVNIERLEEGARKMVVWLDPSEYRSTWLGNKAVHKTRMAVADRGELLVLAPGLAHFGEDPQIDSLIRKYGYRPSREVRELVKRNEDLSSNLSAAAHLIHGSSEGRFDVVYAPGPGISRGDIESIGYRYADIDESLARYDPERMKRGWNEMPDGERVFFVQNPALGLWTTKERFEEKK